MHEKLGTGECPVSPALYKLALALMFIVVIVLSAALYVSNRRLREQEQSPIVETPILRERAIRLEPSEAKYDVVVWNRTKWSTSAFDTRDIFQIRIEVKTGSDEYTFTWANNDACAPDAAELRDVTGKGWKAFVISCNSELRIVRFNGVAFVFRPSVDQIPSDLNPSAFVDLDKDGSPEYIAVLNFPQKFGDPSNYTTLPFPTIYRWSPEHGFREVSGRFPGFYENRAIPELRKQQQNEPDNQRRELFQKAIEYIEQKLSSKSTAMLPVS